MKLPRRQPRQVYRVLDEDEFLGDHYSVAPPPLAPRVADQPQAKTEPGDWNAGARRSERSSARMLVPALVLVAVAAVGAIALQAISHRIRVRQRITTDSPRRLTPSSRSLARRPWSAVRGGRRPPRSPLHARLRGGSSHGRGKRENRLGATPTLVPEAPPSGSVSAAGGAAEQSPAEFSFERRVDH